jgi:hypothetical protein
MFSFILAAIVFTLLLVVPLPGNDVSYITDPTLHIGIRQVIYWGLGFAALLFIGHKNGEISIMESIFCLFFGPVIWLMLGFYWLSLKIIPRKV